MGLTRFERALRRRRGQTSDAEAVVEAWEASSSSMTGFATAHGIKFERLRRWRSRLRREREPAPPGGSETLIPLAPVVVRAFTEPAEQPAPAPITPTHGVLDVTVGPAVVRVPADFDDEHLRRVVAALARAC